MQGLDAVVIAQAACMPRASHSAVARREEDA